MDGSVRTLLLSVEDHVTFLEVGPVQGWCRAGEARGGWAQSGLRRPRRRRPRRLRCPSTARPPARRLPQGRKVRHGQENKRWIDDYK